MGLKLLRAAGVGALAMLVATAISNLLFFQIGRPLLFDPELQSAKLMAVLFEMEPRPLMFANGPLYMAVALVVGALHGLVFAWLEPVLPQGRVARGLGFGAVLWALTAVYFEFHAPFNMFREPPALVALELAFWVPVMAAEGLVLSLLYGTGRRGRTAAPAG